ncbi:EAL domain-containing protein [Vreelandella rituensis]|nr:EAL domain-containing protein [Halomonas rituensis]
MGLGVWSMHFIGMHAYRLDFTVTHAPLLTLASVLPAILGSLGAMVVLSRDDIPHLTLFKAGIGLGGGIGVMHYTGMAAMRMPAVLYHALDLFLVSLVVAIGLGILSVYAYRLCQQGWGQRWERACASVSALCVSIAVCGMHYVAMQAAWFLPTPGVSASPSVMSGSHWLIYFISGSAVLIAALTLIASRVQRRLNASERDEHMTRSRLLEVISSLQEGVVLFDDRARIRLCNAAFERLMGVPTEELIGASIWQMTYAKDSQALNERIQQALLTQGKWRGMIQALSRQGQVFPAWLNVSRVTYADSDDRDYVALLSYRSEEQQAQQRIHYLAYHDSLTSLPNRRALQERLVECAQQASTESGWALLILFDIDRFKVLNDSLSQDIGDELLRQMAERLQQWQDNVSQVARLDGNEFALLAPLPATSQAAAEQEALRLTAEVQTSLTADYQLHGHTYPCRLNVGMLVFAPYERDSSATLFKRAGLALLEAKRHRDGDPQRFHQAQEDELEERLTLEGELRRAIYNHELCLHLQPQVDEQRRVIGAEALVRWSHPERGNISPGRFIPLAEETGLILPLGLWVLKEGCRILGEWCQDPGYHHLKLSLNVSVRQFQQPNFVDQVLASIEQYAAPAERLTLELTESLFLNDPEGTVQKMTELRKKGIRFALDDFGTGYSSLAYLKALPLDTLKIDIAFVRDLTLNMQATPIAGTIIALAESLGLAVIAEGVETEDQREVLAHLGCSTYQGFLFGRPVPVESFLPEVLTDTSATSTQQSTSNPPAVIALGDESVS